MEIKCEHSWTGMCPVSASFALTVQVCIWSRRGMIQNTVMQKSTHWFTTVLSSIHGVTYLYQLKPADGESKAFKQYDVLKNSLKHDTYTQFTGLCSTAESLCDCSYDLKIKVIFVIDRPLIRFTSRSGQWPAARRGERRWKVGGRRQLHAVRRAEGREGGRPAERNQYLTNY